MRAFPPAQDERGSSTTLRGALGRAGLATRTLRPERRAAVLTKGRIGQVLVLTLPTLHIALPLDGRCVRTGSPGARGMCALLSHLLEACASEKPWQ